MILSLSSIYVQLNQLTMASKKKDGQILSPVNDEASGQVLATRTPCAAGRSLL